LAGYGAGARGQDDPHRLRGRQSRPMASGLDRPGAVRLGLVDLDRGHLSRLRRTPGRRSARSSAISPGPKAAPASAWIQTPAQAASKAPTPWAMRPATIPQSVSPEPAVAR